MPGVFTICRANIGEWLCGWSGPYSEGEVVDPQGQPKRIRPVLRGGSFYDLPSNVSPTFA